MTGADGLISIQCIPAGARPEGILLSHCAGVLVAILITLVFDRVLNHVVRIENSGARWFALHSITNLAITLTCLADLLATLQSPLCAMQEDMASWLPS